MFDSLEVRVNIPLAPQNMICKDKKSVV